MENNKYKVFKSNKLYLQIDNDGIHYTEWGSLRYLLKFLNWREIQILSIGHNGSTSGPGAIILEVHKKNKNDKIQILINDNFDNQVEWEDIAKEIILHIEHVKQVFFDGDFFTKPDYDLLIDDKIYLDGFKEEEIHGLKTNYNRERILSRIILFSALIVVVYLYIIKGQ